MRRRQKSQCGYTNYTCKGLPQLSDIYTKLKMTSITATAYDQSTTNAYYNIPKYISTTYNNFLNLPRVIQGPVKSAFVHAGLASYKPSVADDQTTLCTTSLNAFNDGLVDAYSTIKSYLSYSKPLGSYFKKRRFYYSFFCHK